MMNFYLILLLSLQKFKKEVIGTYIQRTSEGDIFKAECDTCHLYNAGCSTFTIFSCCTECQCYGQSTYFQGMCQQNPDFNCQFYLEDRSHFFFEHHQLITTTLQRDGVSWLGKIVRHGEYSPIDHQECEPIASGEFWNSERWQRLNTHGTDDFRIHNGRNQVTLYYVGDEERRPWYEGLLIRFTITCRSYTSGTVTSCLVVKISGTRNYDKTPLTTEAPNMKTSTAATFKKQTTTTVTTTLSTTHAPTTTLTTKLTTKLFATTQHDVTTNTHKHDNATKVLVPHTTVRLASLSSQTTISASRAKKSSENKSNVLSALVGTSAFLFGFFCLFLVFGKHRKRKSRSKNKLLNETIWLQSYESNSAHSNEFERVHEPSYTDFNELKLKLLDEERAQCNAVSNDDLLSSANTTVSGCSENSPIYPDQNINGVYYMNMCRAQRSPSENLDFNGYGPAEEPQTTM